MHPIESVQNRIMKYGRRWTFQPKIEWVKEIVEACDKAGIKIFMKDNLRPLIDESHGWGKAVELIQETPNATR